MLEKFIEEHLVKRIKAKGGIAYKFTSPQRRSVPDRLVLEDVAKAGAALKNFVEQNMPCPRPAFSDAFYEQEAALVVAAMVKFIETKATGKKATPLQEREHAFLRDLGFEVLVIDSKEEINERWPK